ncbi:hypothetical protein C4K38_3132 [Pseudomonas chlororaphis subsp. piscium]|uniref:nuclear transport factor 2 family protein n=1 Tax=Pseudomonas chlororaphis TaxID=587753 RepID=UPI0006A57D86|nr:nuclear transport factor 2 family protein [Pseudomonas chlororaphis]AZC31092.1 hypothetical protein C4K38_3132 [Pseudomonas chlororaphis subsp. piscium]WDG88899.1 nuclear transport factor 2 family protein [Pseudomonas chlororaphis]SDT01077.1 Putative lumazine-binding [Pseudomonas chlororaphis]
MSHPSHIQEYQGIIDTLGHYIAGNRLASSEAMKPAFHEQATIYGLNGTEFFGPDIQQLYDDIDRFPASPDLQSSVTRVDIVGNAASVRLDLDNVDGHRFTDFLNLLKIDGQWTVISKVFYLHPGPA